MLQVHLIGMGLRSAVLLRIYIKPSGRKNQKKGNNSERELVLHPLIKVKFKKWLSKLDY